MMARKHAGVREYGAGALLIFVLWFMTWTWPVWPWSVGSFLVAWLLHTWRQRLDPGAEASSWRRDLLRSLAKDGRDAMLAMTFGCLIVMAAQFVFRLCSSILKEGVVREGEYYLSSTQHGLAYVLSLQVLAIVLAGSVLLSVIFPRLRLAKGLVDHKKLLSKILIATTAASSFTFFGFGMVEAGEQRWTARRRGEFERVVTRIGDSRRQLVAAETIKRTLPTSPIGFRTDLREFVVKSAGRADAEVIAEGAAERLGRQAPALAEAHQSSDENRKEAILDGIIDDVRVWTSGKGLLSHQPSVRDLIILTKAADRLETAVSESHAAVVEAVKTAAAGMVPAHADAFVRSFAKSLVGAVARHAAASVYPRNVSDVRTAALWLDLAAGEPRANRAELDSRYEWRMSLRSAERFELTTEAAVAVEIQVAKSEGEERRKREAAEQEARRLEIKRANEEYRAREANRRAAEYRSESYRGESYRAAPRGAR